MTKTRVSLNHHTHCHVADKSLSTFILSTTMRAGVLRAALATTRRQARAGILPSLRTLHHISSIWGPPSANLVPIVIEQTVSRHACILRLSPSDLMRAGKRRAIIRHFLSLVARTCNNVVWTCTCLPFSQTGRHSFIHSWW